MRNSQLWAVGFRHHSGTWVQCGAVVQDGRVTRDSAPVLRRFYGQPLENLAHWIARQGGTCEQVEARCG